MHQGFKLLMLSKPVAATYPYTVEGFGGKSQDTFGNFWSLGLGV